VTADYLHCGCPRFPSRGAYRLSVKGGGSLLVATGYRSAIEGAIQLVRLSREAPPEAVGLFTDLVLPLTLCDFGMLAQARRDLAPRRRTAAIRSRGWP